MAGASRPKRRQTRSRLQDGYYGTGILKERGVEPLGNNIRISKDAVTVYKVATSCFPNPKNLNIYFYRNKQSN